MLFIICHVNKASFLFSLLLLTVVTAGCAQVEQSTTNMSLMQECSDDLNNDSEKEIIQLYASIEKTRKGNFYLTTAMYGSSLSKTIKVSPVFTRNEYKWGLSISVSAAITLAKNLAVQRIIPASAFPVNTILHYGKKESMRLLKEGLS